MEVILFGASGTHSGRTLYLSCVPVPQIAEEVMELIQRSWR